MQNISPWLSTPGVDTVYTQLPGEYEADIVVVGGGIAGCMSAYYLLHNTTRDIVLIEGGRIARGATGHNAGQIDVFFETPVKELIETYGIDMARDGYEAMFDAWVKLEEIIEHIQRQGQYSKYIGYNVYTTTQQLIDVCEQLRLFDELGLEINEFFVLEGSISLEDIPTQYHQYINRISKQEGQGYIGSETIDWMCFEATHYATINSATLCHAILQYLLAAYPDRFTVYEETMVTSIDAQDVGAVLHTQSGRVVARDIVLCTNAYTSYTINGIADDLHVENVKGYMAGYYVPDAKVPATIGYQPPTNSYVDGYYYHSVRHFHDMEHTEHTLVTLGGPDMPASTEEYPIAYKQDLDTYIKNFYRDTVKGEYYRSGDMGYTDTGLRKIGKHKIHNHIWYNIGCNGVGILGSIHGGWKISQFMQGSVSEQSIFDI